MIFAVWRHTVNYERGGRRNGGRGTESPLKRSTRAAWNVIMETELCGPGVAERPDLRLCATPRTSSWYSLICIQYTQWASMLWGQLRWMLKEKVCVWALGDAVICGIGPVPACCCAPCHGSGHENVTRTTVTSSVREETLQSLCVSAQIILI